MNVFLAHVAFCNLDLVELFNVGIFGFFLLILAFDAHGELALVALHQLGNPMDEALIRKYLLRDKSMGFEEEMQDLPDVLVVDRLLKVRPLTIFNAHLSTIFGLGVMYE